MIALMELENISFIIELREFEVEFALKKDEIRQGIRFIKKKKKKNK